MNKILLIILLLQLIPNCSPKRINTQKERRNLNQETALRIDKNLTTFNFADNLPELPYNFYTGGISLHEAINISLKHNKKIATDIESLGIAKADLVQAALLSNPYLESAFKIPQPQRKNEDSRVELYLSFSISDLWQIPGRKKVAQDELEITSMEIINTIMEIFTQTKIAYYTSLHAEAQVKLAQQILNESLSLKKQVDYRKQLGYSSELDTNLTKVMVNHWQIALIESKHALYSSFRELENILGIKSSNKPILLTDAFCVSSIELPSLEELENLAIQNRPELQVMRLRIQKAEDQIKYEQSLFIPSVECGLSYERENNKKKFVGPLLNISLPIFDTNYAQVARARAKKKQFEQDYYYTRKATLTEVKQLYNKINALKQLINQYTAMMPSFHDALRYVKKHLKNMQFTMITFYQTRIAYYEEQSKALTTQLELLKTLAQLEKTIGKEIWSHDRNNS